MQVNAWYVVLAMVVVYFLIARPFMYKKMMSENTQQVTSPNTQQSAQGGTMKYLMTCEPGLTKCEVKPYEKFFSLNRPLAITRPSKPDDFCLSVVDDSNTPEDEYVDCRKSYLQRVNSYERNQLYYYMPKIIPNNLYPLSADNGEGYSSLGELLDNLQQYWRSSAGVCDGLNLKERTSRSALEPNQVQYTDEFGQVRTKVEYDKDENGRDIVPCNIYYDTDVQKLYDHIYDTFISKMPRDIASDLYTNFSKYFPMYQYDSVKIMLYQGLKDYITGSKTFVTIKDVAGQGVQLSTSG